MSSERITPSGTYQEVTDADGQYEIFLPSPLTRFVKEFEPSRELHNLTAQANRVLGKLDGLFVRTDEPDQQLILYSYIRKEAVLSSQIEGTQSSLNDLMEYEAGRAHPEKIDDIVETANYIAALGRGIEALQTNRLPVSSRMIRELHATLLSGTRGSLANPGDFRKTQVRLGGTSVYGARFIPPTANEIPDLMTDLDKFVNDERAALDPLIVAGAAHVQFETIHPFLDGNGRVGRMLIPLILYDRGVLPTPALYLSLYFKENRERYYDALQSVREDGGWEQWLRFFTEAVRYAGEDVFETTLRVEKQVFRDREEIAKRVGKRRAVTAVFEHFARNVISNAVTARESTNLSKQSVQIAINELEAGGWITEVTGAKRNRIYRYDNYMRILEL